MQELAFVYTKLQAGSIRAHAALPDLSHVFRGDVSTDVNTPTTRRFRPWSPLARSGQPRPAIVGRVPPTALPATVCRARVFFQFAAQRMGNRLGHVALPQPCELLRQLADIRVTNRQLLRRAYTGDLGAAQVRRAVSAAADFRLILRSLIRALALSEPFRSQGDRGSRHSAPRDGHLDTGRSHSSVGPRRRPLV